MELQRYDHERLWNTTQQPRCQGHRSASYLLLLSALDKGWQIVNAALSPSWDQTGFVYIISLSHPASPLRQELILPRNALTDNILNEIRTAYQVKTPATCRYT